MLNKIQVHLAGIATLAFLSVFFTANVFTQWQPEVRLTTDANYSTTSGNNAWCIAANGNTVHVVWVDAILGGTYSAVFYKRSTDGGMSWGSNMLLAGGPYTPYNPSIAVSGSVVHVVWTETKDPVYHVEEIYYRRSTDGGNSWEQAIAINTNGTSGRPSVTASGSVVIVVWEEQLPDNKSDIYYRSSTAGGASWGSVTPLTTAGYAGGPVAAVSGLAVNVAWSDWRDATGPESEIYLKRSTNGGASWGADTRLTNATGMSWYPSMTAVGSTLHLVWEDRRNGLNSPDVYYKRSLDGGVNWGTDTRINNTGNAEKPSVSASGSTVHVVWEDSPDFNTDVYDRFSTNSGLNWQPTTRLTFDTTYQRNASVSVSGSTVHVVWEDSRHVIVPGQNTEIYYRRNLTSGAIFVTSPQTGELILADAPYDIQWQVSGIDSLRIDFSIDSTRTWTQVVRSVPSSSGHYTWMVPDTLSTRCFVRMRNVNDSLQKAESGRFKIKGYRLTRTDQNGDYEEFKPERHGWRFGNDTTSMWPSSWWNQFDYVNGIDPFTGTLYFSQYGRGIIPAQPGNFIDWLLFVKGYKPENCYKQNNFVSTRALDFWVANKDDLWGGCCLGFAATALLAFDRPTVLRDSFPALGNFDYLNQLLLNNTTRNLINQIYFYQGDLAHMSYDAVAQQKSPRETLQELKEMFFPGTNDNRFLNFVEKHPSFSHSINAIKLTVENRSLGRYKLFIYDNNLPGTTVSVKIDSSANTWSLGSLVFSDGLYLSEPASNWLLTPRFKNSATASVAASDLRIYNSWKASITITGPNGNTIGFADSAVTGNLAGAVPIVPKTGMYHPPIGYSVTNGEYSARLSSFSSQDAYLYMFGDSVSYSYRRNDAGPAQTDYVSLSNAMSVTNRDNNVKRLTLSSVISVGDTERTFNLTNVNTFIGDSLRIKEMGKSDLLTENFGRSKSYDLQLFLGSQTRSERFRHNAIALDSNSSHRIVPQWTNLITLPVKILIDRGNNGTIDDTIIVVNQATDVPSQTTGEIPQAFALSQNYPNPFNPTTEIRYQIAEVSHVMLKVFDLLGREVQELVNDQMQPGSYSVQFDAKNVSSGTYFYRLQTESFVSTKRMLLVK